MSDAVHEPMMQIGKFAERTGLSVHTIRHYDEVDLLRPSGRSEGGFRLYTDTDLERFLLIRRMKPLGFALEQMREVLEIVDTLAGASGPERAVAQGRLGEFIAAAHERRSRLLAELAMADEFIAQLAERHSS
ncbi:MerR family transcriptional regulator [Pengzhenrongella sp.]|jgi:DNA-binding transcriptional MerR regulator|uniref:MerR family transcriptional regulator n=1 Tax=Pengzhenrongella sp. TaxID=2888820 RepID=UPI002F925D1B